MDTRNERMLRAAIYSNPNGPQTVSKLGNARDVALELIRGDLPLAEFNLDADRGYGYLRWRANGSLPDGPLTNVEFF